MSFIEILPKTVTVKSMEYNEVLFNGVIDKTQFKDFTATVLHGNDCVYSADLKKWFCPTNSVGWIIKQADAFLEDDDDLGALIAEEY